MTVQSYDLNHVDSGILARAIGWVQDRFTEIGNAEARARQMHELEALSDRTLHDIGISRSELLSMVHNPNDVTRAR